MLTQYRQQLANTVPAQAGTGPEGVQTGGYPVQIEGLTTYAPREPIRVTVDIAWNVHARHETTVAASWSVHGRTEASTSTCWPVHGRTEASTSTSWETRQRFETSASTVWAVDDADELFLIFDLPA